MSFLHSIKQFFKNKSSNVVNVNNKFLCNSCVDYFYDLNSDYPINCFGSCGYVAVASLLRYYDYVYDNTIIDDKYKLNKGLKHAEKNSITKLSNKKYYDFLMQSYNEYFQSFLIIEANRRFGIYNSKDKYPVKMGCGSYCHIRGYYTEVQALLDYYLNNIKNFSSKIVTIRIKEDLRNNLIKELKMGNPTIVSCRTKKGKGHIFIVYDYDEENDEIYGNSLTMEGYNHMKISSVYKTFDYAIVLKTM